MKHHILVIEDHAAIAAMLISFLETKGYTVSQARNGREALSFLTSKTPTLILLDLKMPEMDGYTFLNALQHQEPAAPIPVLILTADVQAASMLEQQQVPVVLKPFTFAPLLAVIEQYCQN